MADPYAREAHELRDDPPTPHPDDPLIKPRMDDRLLHACPACGKQSLIVFQRCVSCIDPDCPKPGLLAAILGDYLSREHVVRFDEDSFSVQHPLIERGEDLTLCELHAYIQSLDGPLEPLGLYIARREGGSWRFLPVPENPASA